MIDRYAAKCRDHEETVLGGPGETEPSLRRALAEGGAAVPEDLRALVDTIERAPYKVSDEQIAALRARYSEDQIFEIVVAISMGASMRRLKAGLAALEGA